MNKIKFGFLIVAIQILLLINIIPAQSYIINQENSQNNVPIIQNNSGDLINPVSKLTGFLIGFFTIKQIGIVSAQENVDYNCCLKTNNGAICQNIVSGFDSSKPESCENPLPTSCKETSVCKLGTCIYDKGLSCSANSPMQECEDKNGLWKPQNINEIPECEKGVCVLGSNLEYTTEKQCELLSQSKGLKADFRAGLTEFDFPEIFKNLPKGACTLQKGNCRFVTAIECDSMSGKFYEDYLCSNPNLATNCTPTNQTTCVNDKVYFTDTCGNPANVYDSSKVNQGENPNYWAVVSKPSCTLDFNNPDSVKSCGDCNVFLGSQCSKNSNANYGNYACKDLSCVDEKGNARKNGEKWCMYDSYIGDGKDTVGSEQWLSSCNNGEVKVDMCAGTRGQVCSQSSIKEGEVSFSTASCVVNEALRCLNYNQGGEDCNKNPQCQTKNIDVDKGFKFSVCTPKYPRGFDLKKQSDTSEGLCSIANNECNVVYQKQLFGGWKCIQNCNCEKQVFAEQMNDLCISLGDCGSYVNFAGEGTDNIQVENSPSISWTKYKDYANAVDGQNVDLKGQNEFISSLDTSINPKYIPEEANQIASSLGTSGISFGVMLADAYVNGIKILDVSNGVTNAFSGSKAISEKLGNLFSTESLQSMATPFIGSIIGSLAGKFLADMLGLKGPAATIFTMASGVAGTAIAQILSQGGSFTNFANFYVASLWVSLAVMAFIALSGWGKTKIVKVKFTCLPWQAPSGGNNCEKCNEYSLKPCTKYRCESLGQACKLINEDTNKPICQSMKKESLPPIISIGEIKTKEYKFQNQGLKKVEIRKDNGECIPEFNSVEFTLKTDEYAQCKWGLKPTIDYESMTRYLAEGTYFTKNHTLAAGGLSLSMLKANNVSGDIIQGFTGDIEMYVRCQDSFGNFNPNEYVVNFCINSGEDTTPVSQSSTITLPRNGKILSYGTNKINLTMWTNEPADCKYDLTEGKSYDTMSNSLNCKTNLTNKELFGWPCSAELTNLKNENTFYIKCKDQPWLSPENESKRNTNVEDFVYKLYISKSELNIDSVSVLYNEVKTNLKQDTFTEIKGGGNMFSIELGVETSKGADNGISLCSYKWNNNWIPFLDSNSNSHKQKLNLVNGNYDIPIECEDEAGNKEKKDAKFSLNVDNNAPKIVRTYYESGKLNIITNEQAKCYSSSDSLRQCNFDIKNITNMETGFETLHSISWVAGKTYYIKCSDVWDNLNPGCAVKITTS